MSLSQPLNQFAQNLGRYLGALTSYILGSGGQGVEKTLIYAPAGGSISNLKISGGSVTESRQETLNGKPCMRAMPR